MTPRIPLGKATDEAILKFSTEVKDEVETLANLLLDVFEDFRTGRVGVGTQKIALKLFDEWLTRSQLPTVKESEAYVIWVTTRIKSVQGRKKVMAKKLTFAEKKSIGDLAETIEVEIAKGKTPDEAVRENVWSLYSDKTMLFLTQTAYVVIGRVVMFFLGRDRTFLSLQEPQKGKFVATYWQLVHDFREYLPTICTLNEFDWWYVPPTAPLAGDEGKILDVDGRKIELKLDAIFKHLGQFDYTKVDTDVWKEIYLRVLAEEYTRRLGFVPTPDAIVELILDLVGYSSDRTNLCRRTLLDPSCGSGTFALEAMLRLKEHLGQDMKCHAQKPGLAEWEIARLKLETMIQCIHAIDIHPFASFLTSLNLTFALTDIYRIVKNSDPHYALRLDVVTHDALVNPARFGLEAFTNGRLQEVMRREEGYTLLSSEKFDFVVGNPPWGGVLIGKLGPLGDPNLRQQYKSKFGKVAGGKYDIYVLFLAQGIDWLKEEGRLGMITQIMYLEQAYGKGIKDLIKKSGEITRFVDLSKVGGLIFPGFTNYPAITVIQKHKAPRDSKLMEVTVT